MELTPERVAELNMLTTHDSRIRFMNTIRVDELRALLAAHAREKRLRELLRGVLLFHSGGGWTVEMQADWLGIFGETDATTGVMCRAIRKALEQFKEADDAAS
jgi:hypothetical protein